MSTDNAFTDINGDVPNPVWVVLEYLDQLKSHGVNRAGRLVVYAVLQSYPSHLIDNLVGRNNHYNVIYGIFVAIVYAVYIWETRNWVTARQSNKWKRRSFQWQKIQVDII